MNGEAFNCRKRRRSERPYVVRQHVGHDDDRRLDDERQRRRRPSVRRFMHLQRERHHSHASAISNRLHHLHSHFLRSEFLRGGLTVSLDSSDASNLAFAAMDIVFGRLARRLTCLLLSLIALTDRQSPFPNIWHQSSSLIVCMSCGLTLSFFLCIIL
jgi:hypothetical protein